MIDKLEFKIINYQPCSVNDAYIATAKRGNGKSRYRSAYYRKSPELERWQSFINKAFEDEVFYTKQEIEEFTEYLENNDYFIEFKLTLSIPKDIFFTKNQNDIRTLDASNYIKVIEDSISSNIGINDKYNLKVSSRKTYNEDGVWYIHIELLPTKIEVVDVDITNAHIKE